MSTQANKDDIVVDVGGDAKKPGWVQDPTSVDTGPASKEKLEIEVVDDRPDADKNRPARDPKAKPYDVSDEDIAKYTESAQKRIKTLRYEFHEERRQREAAQREKEAALQYAQHVKQAHDALQAEAASRATEHLEQSRTRNADSLTLAQSALAAALESGKSDDIAKAQVQLGRVIAQGEILGQAPVRQKQEPVVQQQQPVQQQPAQNLAQQTAPDPKAVTWLKANPWFGSDKKMTGFAYGVHEELVTEEGVDPRSDEYYEKINAAMRDAFPKEFDDAPAAKPAKQEQRPNIVAPPARGSAPRKITLTASQAAVAKRLGLTLEQYATQLVKESQANG